MGKYARVAFSAGPQRCDDGVWSRQKDEWAQHLYSYIIETVVHCRGPEGAIIGVFCGGGACPGLDGRDVRRFWVCLFCLSVPPQLATCLCGGCDNS